MTETLTVTLVKSEIIYDAQNVTYIIGKNLTDGTNQEAVSKIILNDDEENKNKVYRAMQAAWYEMLLEISSYVNYDLGSSTNNVLDRSDDNLVASLSVPTTFDKSALNGLTSHMHSYMVNKVLYDWYLTSNGDKATAYLTDAANDLQMINNAINKRVAPIL